MYKLDNPLVVYMKEVNISVEEFKILDRYRGYLEILNEYKLKDRDAYYLLKKLFSEKELDIFKDVENYIVNGLRKHAMNYYLQNKPNIKNEELLNLWR